jgi:hypothetical protein
MPYNGTAVEGVCVTGATSRVLVPVASWYGAVFARPNGVSRAGKVGCGWLRYHVTMTKGFG